MVRRLVSALAGALVVACGASSSNAAIIFQESGLTQPRICAPNKCIGGYLGASYAINAPGDYRWSITVDPEIVNFYIDPTGASFDGFYGEIEEYWDDYYADGRLSYHGATTWQSLPQTAPYFIETSTGFTGTFTVPATQILPVGSHGGGVGDYELDSYYVVVSLNGYLDPSAGPEPYSFTVQSVPEPRTWAMMLAGFFALGGALRYRRTLLHQGLAARTYLEFSQDAVQNNSAS